MNLWIKYDLSCFILKNEIVLTSISFFNNLQYFKLKLLLWNTLIRHFSFFFSSLVSNKLEENLTHFFLFLLSWYFTLIKHIIRVYLVWGHGLVSKKYIYLKGFYRKLSLNIKSDQNLLKIKKHLNKNNFCNRSNGSI